MTLEEVQRYIQEIIDELSLSTQRERDFMRCAFQLSLLNENIKKEFEYNRSHNANN